MTLHDLQNYNKWIGNSAETIKNSVIHNGGWERVFPKSKPFPVWASRVRNFFNEYPKSLKQIDAIPRQNSNQWINRRIQDEGFLYNLYTSKALSDVKYLDEKNRIWYEMSKAGTGYHFEDRSFLDKYQWSKGLNSTISFKSSIPVFKLICPERTGGSLEVIIHNFQLKSDSVWDFWGTSGKSEIGPIGKEINVGTLINNNEIFRGSYNYSETSIRGFGEHEFRDIKPHKANSGFYINPNMKSPLSYRIFPKKYKGEIISKTHEEKEKEKMQDRARAKSILGLDDVDQFSR